jgi:SEC-C motif domain protein
MAKRRRSPAARPTGCPCGGPSFDECCGPVLADPRAAASPEALMRSRYTAHTRHDVDHLAATWHPDHRPPTIAHDPEVRWRGLEIVDAPPAAENEGSVEFIASFSRGDESHRLHERSRFVLIDGTWLYTDGDLQPARA